MVRMYKKNVILHYKTPTAAPLRENLSHRLGLTNKHVLVISCSTVPREQLTDSLAYSLDSHSTVLNGSMNAHAEYLTFRYSWLKIFLIVC